jgi:hypothetical protein
MHDCYNGQTCHVILELTGVKIFMWLAPVYFTAFPYQKVFRCHIRESEREREQAINVEITSCKKVFAEEKKTDT